MAGLLSDVLPAVYSASNVMKNKLRGLLDDPLGTLQQVVGDANDQARSFNQMGDRSAAETIASVKAGKGLGSGPASNALLGKIAEAYNPVAMTVWHGSPHRFSKFDASKIGTGEGAQAYGHGLYLAESQKVANEYASKLSNPIVDFARKVPFDPVEIAIQKKLQSLAKTTQTGSKLDEISKVFDSYLNPNLTRWNPKHPNANAYNGMAPIEGEELKQVIALRDAAKRLGKPDLGDSGSLYKIDLPDNQIAKMLDWDAPMTGQSDLYKQVAKEKELPYRGNTPKGGMDIYNSLVDQLGSPEAATKFLRDQGIPGIRYLDGGSRGAGQGSSNFVVFPGNENILQILERNGQPVNALRGLLER